MIITVPYEHDTGTVEKIALAVTGLSTLTGTAMRAQAPNGFSSSTDIEDTTVSPALTVV
jgi:hypothetical protein